MDSWTKGNRYSRDTKVSSSWMKIPKIALDEYTFCYNLSLGHSIDWMPHANEVLAIVEKNEYPPEWEEIEEKIG